MSEKQINWCNCGRQYQEYWRIKENVYGLNFDPTAWAFEYRTITAMKRAVSSISQANAAAVTVSCALASLYPRI